MPPSLARLTTFSYLCRRKPVLCRNWCGIKLVTSLFLGLVFFLFGHNFCFVVFFLCSFKIYLYLCRVYKEDSCVRGQAWHTAPTFRHDTGNTHPLLFVVIPRGRCEIGWTREGRIARLMKSKKKNRPYTQCTPKTINSTFETISKIQTTKYIHLF